MGSSFSLLTLLLVWELSGLVMKSFLAGCIASCGAVALTNPCDQDAVGAPRRAD